MEVGCITSCMLTQVIHTITDHQCCVYLHRMQPECPLFSTHYEALSHISYLDSLPKWHPLDLLYSVCCEMELHGTVLIGEYNLLLFPCTQMALGFIVFLPGRWGTVCQFYTSPPCCKPNIHPYAIHTLRCCCVSHNNILREKMACILEQ